MEMQKGENKRRVWRFLRFAEGPLLLLLKALSVLAGGVIGVKQTVFNTQELELPRSCSDVGF
jgi:hypothetical protein